VLDQRQVTEAGEDPGLHFCYEGIRMNVKSSKSDVRRSTSLPALAGADALAEGAQRSGLAQRHPGGLDQGRARLGVAAL
jgi:hypothetical protein